MNSRPTDAMNTGRTPSPASPIPGKGDRGFWLSKSDAVVRNQNSGSYSLTSAMGKRVENPLHDQELADLLLATRSQEHEILLLHRQIAEAAAKELQLLNEKHVLEMKLWDLRMALDEKHNSALSDTLRDLSSKKSYVEDNIKKASDLKVMEEESHTFTTSLLSLLSEYGIRPAVLDAFSISANVKRLYHQLQWRIRSSQASIGGMNNHIGNQRADVVFNNTRPPQGFRNQPNQEYNPHDVYMESPSSQSRFAGDHDMVDVRDAGNAKHADLQFPFGNEILRGTGSQAFSPFDETSIARHVASTKHGPEAEKPGIIEFQILGDAVPSSTLLACGFPTNGTSLCIFQWVRHLQDGTRHYIEGATNPEYTVTADDVDKIIAVECIPMDETGCQGELVRQFANNQNKITCDPNMQEDIQSYVSVGRAEFNVFLLRDSSDEWQPAIIILKRISYQVKISNNDILIIAENYTDDISIKVPYEVSTQFVLTCSDGTSHPFDTGGITQPSNAFSDLRLRDIIVLTMRIFQAKALDDDKRKGKLLTR